MKSLEKSGKKTNYQKQQKGRSGQSSIRIQGQLERGATGSRESAERMHQRLEGDKIDSQFGFDRLTEGAQRLGWLLNFLPTTMPDETGSEKSGIDLYFLDREGGNFKATIFFEPYFLVDVSDPRRSIEVSNTLLKRFEGCKVSQVDMEDLDLPNHLAGKTHKMLKLSFGTVNELMDARNILRPIIQLNQKHVASMEQYYYGGDAEHPLSSNKPVGASGFMDVAADPMSYLVDLREHDVPYAMRAAIDLSLRVGCWYQVKPESGSQVCSVDQQKDFLELGDPGVLAFDIECEKSPLKFPNAEVDRIFMISYMYRGQGYLIINREVVSEDIMDFEYTPKPHYPGPFEVFNEANEEALLRKFLLHVQELRPHVIVTYNGDRFDWPYVESRCNIYADLSLYHHLGIRCSAGTSGKGRDGKPLDAEYVGRCIVHLDAFCWVQRDSYLPQGQQGLKAVTRSKLGYDPVEVDPEDMVKFAQEQPHHMASYSVSDAVATFYLYTTYVHNFIFSLCTIIPMGPEDVLRKGSGTLCEALLMVEAYRGNIVCPNKQVDPLESFHEGHLMESETYIGGHVECLEAGVFRADIPAKFTLVPAALQQLIDNIDRDLTFALETEHGVQRSEVLNYEQVKQAIVEKLEMLRDSPVREESPLIYHLDVGAMYPNIILTNRLQPSAIVNTHDCAACDFNRAENGCKRPMTWTWRGDFSPATQSDYQAVKRQLAYERVPAGFSSSGNNYNNNKESVEPKSFLDLSERDQAQMVRTRLKSYAHRVYKKTKTTVVEDRVNTVCMRENSFYVDTVKAFRDRRYEYKLLTKTWKGKKLQAEKAGDVVGRKQAEDREVLMDSLQLAHKCILNSFYGYVMRKGARWRSMEMAGIVTYTGAQLIKQARELVEQVGRPLELDTDGIWCILPSSFPQDFKFKTAKGSIGLGYPCAMLNADVHERYTNHQYQELVDSGDGNKHKKYATHSECSIFFELDGPYKAMILPASPEEGKLLKKKYVVFNFDGSVAELKGFELKRRGELELVKIFQSQVFENFLAGSSLEDCYQAVGAIGNQWLDVLDNKGRDMDDQELLELISERKTISKTVDDYEGRKSTSLTTAGRLADFLGQEITKDRGLNCNLLISRFPSGAPVTERAIPVAIYSCEPAIKKYFLRKWLKDQSLECEDFREVIDWEYYKERLGKSIQKIITIPAGMQRVSNPCPRVIHPPWLVRNLREHQSGKKQMNIRAGLTLMSLAPATHASSHATPGRGQRRVSFNLSDSPENVGEEGNKKKRGAKALVGDLEDIGGDGSPGKVGRPVVHMRQRRGDAAQTPVESEEEAKEEVEEEVEVLPLGLHKPQSPEELQSWLLARKAQWRETRRRRREAGLVASRPVYGRTAREHMSATGMGAAGLNALLAGDPANKRPLGVMDLVRQASLTATKGIWQVLELQETSVPGQFVVWALTSNAQLQRLQLVVPRTLFVNIYSSANGRANEAESFAQSMGGCKVKKELPHGKRCRELYEINLPEHRFLRNEKALSLFLCNSQVEGVYESQVPLDFRAITQMGCVSQVNGLKKHNTAAGGLSFELQDIDLVNVRSHPYLTPEVAQFRRIFLYFSADSSRGVLSMFQIESTNGEEAGDPQDENAPPLCAKVHVWVIAGRSGVAGLSVPRLPLQRIYQKFQRSPGNPNDPDTHKPLKFTQTVCSSVSEALQLCNEKLLDYQREKHGPTVVVAQGSNNSAGSSAEDLTIVDCSLDSKQWRYFLPALHEFPLAPMPANSTDSRFPAVGWQLFVAERMIQRFLIFPRWFRDRLRCSRYSHTPLCNLGSDALTTMLDVNFARQLAHNRHLLWTSSAGANCPDIGGGSDSRDQAHLLEVWSDRLQEPIINESGVHRKVCVELDLFGLAVCAIMSSGELDAEGLTSALQVTVGAASGKAGLSSKGLEEGDEGDSDGEENEDQAGERVNEDLPVGGEDFSAFSESSCSRAFNIFRALVTKCIEDVNHGERPQVSEEAQCSAEISNNILTASYRYLCGYGNGFLSDPLLHRVVYGLMRKLFHKLIGSLRRLGTQVVYADFSKIIVNTNKQGYSAAKEYMDFILSAISARPIFSYLDIGIKSFWEQLTWLGPENWGGIPLTPPVDPSDHPEEDFPEDLADPAGTVRAHDASFDQSDDDEEDEFGFLDDINRTVVATRKPLSSRGGLAEDGEDNIAHIKSAFGLGTTQKKGKGKKGGQKNSRSSTATVSYEDQWIDEGPELGESPERGAEAYEEAYEEEEEERLVEEHWNLASFYPDGAAKSFLFIVGEFMTQYKARRETLLRQHYLDSLSAEFHSQTVAQIPEEGPALLPDEEERINEQVLEYMRSLLQQSLTTRMLQIVDDLNFPIGGSSAALAVDGQVHHHRHHHQVAGDEKLFPQKAGSFLPMRSPALEFVKAATHVMSLDPSLAPEVSALRRLLLTQLRVREFSEESQFQDPSLSFVLRDVICSYCSTCRDVDMLRDEGVIDPDPSRRWMCLGCENRLDTEEIENRLIDEVDRMSVAYLLQDFRCPKTNLSSRRLASPVSDHCNKPLLVDAAVSDTFHQLNVLKRVAEFHEFPFLKDAVEQLV